MKFNAYLRPQFTADVYNLRSNHEDPNGALVPVFYKTVKLHYANDPNSVRSVAVCDEELPPGGMVKNIKDKTGFLFMGDTEFTITRVIPVFNVWQNLEGYQVTLAVSQYKMLSEIITADEMML